MVSRYDTSLKLNHPPESTSCSAVLRPHSVYDVLVLLPEDSQSTFCLAVDASIQWIVDVTAKDVANKGLQARLNPDRSSQV